MNAFPGPGYDSRTLVAVILPEHRELSARAARAYALSQTASRARQQRRDRRAHRMARTVAALFRGVRGRPISSTGGAPAGAPAK